MNFELFSYILAVIYTFFCSIVLIAEFNRFRKLPSWAQNAYIYNLNPVPFIVFVISIVYIITYHIS